MCGLGCLTTWLRCVVAATSRHSTGCTGGRATVCKQGDHSAWYLRPPPLESVATRSILPQEHDACQGASTYAVNADAKRRCHQTLHS
jgi:hypothetical protein